MRPSKPIVAALAVGLLAVACSSSSSSPASTASRAAGPSGTLTIDNESGGTWTCDFNPFNLT